MTKGCVHLLALRSGTASSRSQQFLRFVWAGLVVMPILAASGARGAAPADLRIRLTASSFTVGRPGTYNVSVRNESQVAADDVIQVVSTLPTGLTLVAGSNGGWICNGSGRSVQCTTTSGLAPGDSTGFTLTVDVCNVGGTSVTTTFDVLYDADPNLGNNSATRTTSVKAGTCIEPTATPTATPRFRFQAPEPTPVTAATDLRLQVSEVDAGAFVVGASAAYRVQVTNLGPAVTNIPVRLEDRLPIGLSFAGATGDGWECAAAGQKVSCAYGGSIQVGATTELTVTVQIASTAYPSVTNYAVLLYPADRNVANSSDFEPTTVRRARGRAPVRPERPVRRPQVAR